MGEGFDEFTEAFGAGEGFGWHRARARYWHGSDALTRVALPAELIGAAIGQLAGHRRRAGRRAARCSTSAAATARRPWPIAALFPARGCSVSTTTTRRSCTPGRRPDAASRNLRFEVGCGHRPARVGYALITFFDSLHDLGDPRGALVRARAALAADGAVLLVEPLAADGVEDNLNPSGRMFYAISTLVCTPERGVAADAGVVRAAGRAGRRERPARGPPRPGSHRCVALDVPAPLNLVLELRP